MAKRYGKYIGNEYDNGSEEEIEPCIDAALELLNLQSVEAYVSTRAYQQKPQILRPCRALVFRNLLLIGLIDWITWASAILLTRQKHETTLFPDHVISIA